MNKKFELDKEIRAEDFHPASDVSVISVKLGKLVFYFSDGYLTAFRVGGKRCERQDFGEQFKDEIESLILNYGLSELFGTKDWRKVDFQVHPGKK